MVKRIQFMVISFLVCLMIFVPASLAYKQVYMYDFYSTKALEQQTRDIIIPAERGNIYDRNLNELAVSADLEQINVDPTLMRKQNENLPFVAESLAEILDLDADYVLEKLEKDTMYETIKRDVTNIESEAVRAFINDPVDPLDPTNEYDAISGIIISPDVKRYYPEASLASNLIGFTGVDGTGLEGIEWYYDDVLSGTPGRIISARDAAGNEVGFGYDELIEPKDGNSLVLTIDEVIQYYLEKHLEIAQADNDPLLGVSGIIMDIETGEILAIANTPNYDPNSPFEIEDEMLLEIIAEAEAEFEGEVDEDGETEEFDESEYLRQMWRNKPVVDSFEPGSIFKLFTVSTALEEDIIDENYTYTCNGYSVVAGRRISCHKEEGHGTQTLMQTIENSCNPAMMDIADKMGSEIFLEYYELFGFEEETGIDLPGETSGIFHLESNFNEVELATSSFGQTFQVTPLQLITAVSAIANDGYMVTPHVVKEVIDSEGRIIEQTVTEPKKQVISAETSEFMREAMESTVSIGGGKNAYVKGYQIGGKSSTSEKVSKTLETGENYYISSFIGVAPIDDPKYAVLVSVDEPQAGYIYGGTVAAPIVARIMSDILPYVGIEPTYTEEELATISAITPNLIGDTIDEVENELKNQNLSYRVVGSGDTVTDQVPAAGSRVPSSATMIVYLGEEKPTEDVEIPDITGLSPSQAKRILENEGLFLEITGTSARISGGTSTIGASQFPQAGNKVSIGTVVTGQFIDSSSISD